MKLNATLKCHIKSWTTEKETFQVGVSELILYFNNYCINYSYLEKKEGNRWREISESLLNISAAKKDFENKTYKYYDWKLSCSDFKI